MQSQRVKFLDRGQRTFCIGVSGISSRGSGTLLDVPFVDSAGNLIKCNYFSIQAQTHDYGSLDFGVLVAEVSGIAHLGDMESLAIRPLSSTLSPSGICGVGSVLYRTGRKTQWHGSNGQVATGVKIVSTVTIFGLQTTPKMAFVITYGNLFPLNSRRLEQSYDAGV